MKWNEKDTAIVFASLIQQQQREQRKHYYKSVQNVK